MDGAAPVTVDFIAVAYVIAICAVAAAVIGVVQLVRGGTVLLAFGVLLAPWLMVFTDTRIIPVYMSFALAWGNPVLPVWVSPLVGILLIAATITRAAMDAETPNPPGGSHGG